MTRRFTLSATLLLALGCGSSAPPPAEPEATPMAPAATATAEPESEVVEAPAEPTAEEGTEEGSEEEEAERVWERGDYLLVASPRDRLKIGRVRQPSLVIRARPTDWATYNGEPRYDWVSTVLERANEAGAGEEEAAYYLDYDVPAMMAATRRACADESVVPEEFRRGAPIRVLGRRGWVQARIGRCSVPEEKPEYLIIQLTGAPPTAMLALAPHATAPEEASYRRGSAHLPNLDADGLAHAREELTRLELAAQARAEIPQTAVVDLPGARALLHVNVPAEGEEPYPCEEGGCDTGLLLYDPAGATSEVIGHVEADGVELYEIAATVSLGDRRGIVLRYYVQLGFEEISVLTVGPDDRLEAQALFWFSDDGG